MAFWHRISISLVESAAETKVMSAGVRQRDSEAVSDEVRQPLLVMWCHERIGDSSVSETSVVVNASLAKMPGLERKMKNGYFNHYCLLRSMSCNSRYGKGQEQTDCRLSQRHQRNA